MAATPEPLPLLIGDIFRRNATLLPDAVAASLDVAVLTHGELDRLANRMAWTLRGLGIGHGDRIVTWADTALEVLPLFVAAAKLGAAFAPVNARLGADEAARVVALARPALLAVDADRAADAAAVAGAAGVKHWARLQSGAGEGGIDLHPQALSLREDDILEPALRETDPHVLFFTSGSTGRPKGVVLSHRVNYLRSFQGVFRDVPERSVCMFPLFHMAAFTLALSAWQTRGEIAFVRAATAEALLEAVERRRANRLYGIPLVWRRILEIPPGRYDLSSLRELDTGTQAVPIELVRALKERFPGTATRIYYGSTEVGSGTTCPDADVLRKPGSVGPPSPGVELRLTEEGEICIRSAYLTDGYFDDPTATAEALRDGWFHTGDLGALDDEGHLYVVGRKKDVIRSGGESVAPTEVETVLAGHPAVADVAVVGVPDPDWGEVVCAVVVVAEGEELDLASLQRHCGDRLAGFKKPRRFARVAVIPRTAATAQVQRPLLVEQLQSGALAVERER
ncbi:MAG: acyl--CoA ligase [Proteobacteria bacterium]|nr:acyl--CoA ligase [Pseudomonadota bacterium]